MSDDGGMLAAGATGDDSAATGIDGGETDDTAFNSGAVYLFARDGGLWTQHAYVKSSDTKSGALFGLSVTLSADGATLAASSRSGVVYLFARDSGLWTQRAYVEGSNTDSFGSVALSGDGATLAVGAIADDSAASGVDGDETDNTATDSGAAYLFTRDSDGLWNTRTYVKASNTDAEDAFGASIALSADGSMLAVGATGEDSAATGVDDVQTDNSAEDSGAAYILELENTL